MAESLYQKIENDIRQKILDGTYYNGYHLMSELDMTKLYEVSRITVRKALINLVNDGYIERTRGKGTQVIYTGEDKAEDSVLQNYSKTIAVILPVLDVVHTNEIFSSIYKCASEAGYSIIIHQTFHDQSLEEKYIKKSANMKVAGVIVYPAQNEKYNEEIIKLVLARFPIILIDRTLDGINVNSVVTDNEKAAYDATKYLIDLGHTNIGIISSPVDYANPLLKRHNGYKRALKEAGFDQDVHLECYDTYNNMDFNLFKNPAFYTERVTIIDNFIKENPNMTAIICLEPIEGAIVIEATRNLGIKIPEELSLVTFDDFTMPNFFFVPPTVVKQDSKLMGRIAFELLLDMIEGNDSEYRHIELNATIIPRKSTGTPRI